MVMRALIAAFAAALAACSGGGSDGTSLLQGCNPVSGVVVGETSAGCLSCGAENLDNAADGSGATFGSIEMPEGASGTGTLRVTHGSVFPAGSLAGMVHSIEYETSTVNVVLNTYEGGVLRETFTFNNGVNSSEMDPGRTGRVSYGTTQPYDAIELSFTRTSGTGAVSARIHEFCSN
jgi:hypothetical protein